LNNPPLVVVVDDEQALLELLIAQLTPEGYQVKTYNNGMRLLEDQETLARCDTVLLDVMMPEMDGFAVCKRIREVQQRFLPILLVTALGETEHKVRGLDAGADDFLTKPTNSSELRARLRAHLRAKHLHDQLDQAHSELQALSVMRDNLISMIVHDLRNPLGSVSMALQMMGDPPNASLIDATTWQLTRGQVEFALDMCEQLLNIRQMEHGQLQADVSMAQLDRTVFAALEPLLLSANLRQVEVDLELESLEWKTDHRLLKRVVMNLISNAVKYSLSGEAVKVVVKLEDGRAVIAVTDHGPGIPPEYHATIFELFSTLGLNKDLPKVGVGLAFAKQAITLLGGTLEVQSQAGQGSTFIITLSPG
jgi:two-component system, sensor histidine kinase and response regulator